MTLVYSRDSDDGRGPEIAIRSALS